jgi:hypothetical protein
MSSDCGDLEILDIEDDVGKTPAFDILSIEC